MAPKRSKAQLLSMNQAREKAMTVAADISLQSLLEQSEKKLQEAAEKILHLESELEAKNLHCTQLASSLERAQQKTAELSSELQMIKLQAEEQHKKLRVEHRARQRGQKRKEILLEQIRLLKSADFEKSQNIKEHANSASKTVDSLIKLEKENSKLQNELSKCLERSQAELRHSHNKFLSLGKKLRESRALSSKFKKQCDRSAVRRDQAITKARKQVLKEQTVHNLLSKGAYTEDTRNLIRLLVKSGCSRDCVSDIIRAVLKSAGITMIGNVSRRTVSRVITEGYYAAQIQLGYEMQNAKSMYQYLSN